MGAASTRQTVGMTDTLPTHRRTITIESFDGESNDEFEIRAVLKDERP